MKTQTRVERWEETRKILPFVLGYETGELKEREIKKLELFEKGLANELKKSDTINQAISKIVKMALAAEFGPSLVTGQGAKAIIDTITTGIMGDAQLRKQALFIINRFANE